MHGRHAGDIPPTDDTVELGRAVEHGVYGHDAGNIPRTDVIVEHGGTKEHFIDGRHAGEDISRTDDTIKRRCFKNT